MQVNLIIWFVLFYKSCVDYWFKYISVDLRFVINLFKLKLIIFIILSLS